MIHRDLKPSNVFLDSESNAKIGDFGLAVETKGGPVPVDADAYDTADAGVAAPAAAPGLRRNDSLLLEGSSSITTGVGTMLYRAPETEMDADARKRLAQTASAESRAPDASVAAVATAGVATGGLAGGQDAHGATGRAAGGAYDEKADMYSLGIIFFEMWASPFDTRMERMLVMQELREHGVVPPRFLSRVPQSAQRIIASLLQRLPWRRPSALQLLASPYMPPKLELEAGIEEALQAMRNPGSEFHNRMLDSLFAPLQVCAAPLHCGTAALTACRARLGWHAC